MTRTTTETRIPVAVPAASVPGRYHPRSAPLGSEGGVCLSAGPAVTAAGPSAHLTVGAGDGGAGAGHRHGAAVDRIRVTGLLLQQVGVAPVFRPQPDPGRRPAGMTGIAAVMIGDPTTNVTTLVRFEKHDPGSTVWRPPV